MRITSTCFQCSLIRWSDRLYGAGVAWSKLLHAYLIALHTIPHVLMDVHMPTFCVAALLEASLLDHITSGRTGSKQEQDQERSDGLHGAKVEGCFRLAQQLEGIAIEEPQIAELEVGDHEQGHE